ICLIGYIDMHFTLRQLQVFASIARQQSVSRAAESLSLSQSATSTSLAELERQSGCQLFDRAGKRLWLNALGRQLLPQVVALLDQAKAIEDLDRKSTRLNSSHVKISYAVFCLKILRPPPRSPLFPYTTLFRSCRREPVPVAIRDQHITGRAGATVRLPVVRSRRQALVAERIGPAVTATGGRPARPGQGHRRPAGRQDRLRLAERRCDADGGQLPGHATDRRVHAAPPRVPSQPACAQHGAHCPAGCPA